MALRATMSKPAVAPKAPKVQRMAVQRPVAAQASKATLAAAAAAVALTVAHPVRGAGESMRGVGRPRLGGPMSGRERLRDGAGRRGEEISLSNAAVGRVQ
jgi:hypothetical protein